jgi:hypothetical protein
MSVETIKEGLKSLNVSELKSVLAHVISLRDQKDEAHVNKMTAILDNKDPNFWVPFDQCEERWANEDAAAA